MKPLGSIIREGDIVSRMFPYRLNLNYTATFTDWDAPLDQRYPQEYKFPLAVDLPCSVQRAVATNGQIIENEYIILCPCIDMSAKDQLPDDVEFDETPYYSLEVMMNGNKNKASYTDILSVDNLPVYNVGDYAVGCKIRVKLKGRNWTW